MEFKDVEQIKYLFDQLDITNKGQVDENDFIQVLEQMSGYKNNKEIIEECVDETFNLLGKVFGSKKITPENLYLIMQNYNK